ncbi:hypothetical protein QP938_01000 [Porticoccaceae bacterium LTM1]|nr:hypothetical protein QP938_01000 [Porticoccaceae bacterium LTM1]
MNKVYRKMLLLIGVVSGLAGCGEQPDKKTVFDPAHWKTNVEQHWATDTEQQRLTLAYEKMQGIADRWHEDVQAFERKWLVLKSFKEAEKLISQVSNDLWLHAKASMEAKKDFDDRPLYWARLGYIWVIKNAQPQFELTEKEIYQLEEIFESASRGRADLEYTSDAPLKILITGFDPFLLDRNILQGNPSGIAALALDGKVIEFNGQKAEINAVTFPVRYEDFDLGEVESLLGPYYENDSVDMVVTISQGRTDFDLERFPGRRRSATAPDNLNIYAAASSKNPIPGLLGGKEIAGPEFVEFSLPVELMQQATGSYAINDNRKVTYLEQGSSEDGAKEPVTTEAGHLTELADKIAVSGSGGGYLSNEISYRSIRLRNELDSSIPTGHIHTPKPEAFTPEIIEPMVEQIEAMLKNALPAL